MKKEPCFNYHLEFQNTQHLFKEIPDIGKW